MVAKPCFTYGPSTSPGIQLGYVCGYKPLVTVKLLV